MQPHSGANANQAVFFALLQPGDKFLGMDLACGGHLTHGSPVNISGKWFHPVAYGVRPDDHLIDYDQVREIAHRERPKLILAGASAPIRARSTSSVSARSPMKSARSSWWIWRTMRG